MATRGLNEANSEAYRLATARKQPRDVDGVFQRQDEGCVRPGGQPEPMKGC